MSKAAEKHRFTVLESTKPMGWGSLWDDYKGPPPSEFKALTGFSLQGYPKGQGACQSAAKYCANMDVEYPSIEAEALIIDCYKEVIVEAEAEREIKDGNITPYESVHYAVEAISNVFGIDYEYCNRVVYNHLTKQQQGQRSFTSAHAKALARVRARLRGRLPF